MTTRSPETLLFDMRELLLAKRDDLSRIAEIERETFNEPWSESALELFVSDRGFCTICVVDGRIASYCTVVTVLDEAQIINVATDKDHRAQGCARDVISFVLDECKRRSLNYISLEVRESNTPAIALYEGSGFSVAGKRRDFYKDPRENALVMTKNI